jgi:hypothetical protein
VVDGGAIPVFVRLLSSPSDDLREQAAWALGNIAGDSVARRDEVISAGAIPAFIEVGSTFTEHTHIGVIRQTVWCLSSICRCKPAPPLAAVRPLLPLLARLLHHADKETVVSACWALSYISDGHNDRIQELLLNGVAPRLVELLHHSSDRIATPALRAVGGIATGDDTQTQVILNLGCLRHLSILLDHHKSSIKKDACWTISNIAAGTQAQIQSVIDAGLVPKLIRLMQEAAGDVQREASWAISNMTSGGTPDQLLYVVQQGALPALCSRLHVTGPRDLVVALEAIANIFRASRRDSFTSSVVEIIHSVEGDDAIESLAQHADLSVSRKAQEVFDMYLQTCCYQAGGAMRETSSDSGDDLQRLMARLSVSEASKSAVVEVSNIAAGTQAQIQSVIDAGLVPKLIRLMQEAAGDVQREASWAISNMTSGGTPEQLLYVVQQGALPALCSALKAEDSGLVATALKSIDSIAKAAATASSMMGTVCLADLCLGIDGAEDYQKALCVLEAVRSGSDCAQALDGVVRDEAPQQPLHEQQLQEQHVGSACELSGASLLSITHSASASECVVCMSSPSEATLVHGDACIGHTCCCMSCAQELKRRGQRCPLCRKSFTLVIRNIMS